MKREYPLFLIDRSKHSAYPYDYVVCLDRPHGFIARAVHFSTDEMYAEFVSRIETVENNEISYISMKLGKGGLALVCEDYLYYFDVDDESKRRIAVLLKKAFKKYIHANVEETPADDLSIESQIKQQQFTVDRAKANYADLLRHANGDRELADYQIALAEATLETLKSFRDNQKLITLNLN